MKRLLGNLTAVVSGLLVAGSAFADGHTGGASGAGLFAIGSGLAMGLAALGGTLAQGNAAGKALEGISKNPGSKDAVFTPMLLALALIEFQAIMGFIIAFMWIGK